MRGPGRGPSLPVGLRALLLGAWLLCGAAGLAGCAGAPPPRRFASRPPAPDPYAVPAGEEWAVPTRLWVTRRPAWPSERLEEEVAAISSLVQLRPHQSSLELIGPEPAVDQVAGYLADRARFAPTRIQVEVAQVRIEPGAWSFEALARTDGGLYAIGSREDGRAVVGSGRPEDGCRLLVNDAQPATIRSLEERAYLAGASWDEGAPWNEGAPWDERGLLQPQPPVQPDVSVLSLGLRCQVTAQLAAEGALVALELNLERSREATGDAPAVRVSNELGTTTMPIELPRIDARRLAGRFVLRRGEALVLLQAPVDVGRDLLATVIIWSVRGPDS